MEVSVDEDTDKEANKINLPISSNDLVQQQDVLIEHKKINFQLDEAQEASESSVGTIISTDDAPVSGNEPVATINFDINADEMINPNETEQPTASPNSNNSNNDIQPEKTAKCQCGNISNLSQFRRNCGRPKKGQKIRWLWKYECKICKIFFGDSWEYHSEIDRYVFFEQKLTNLIDSESNTVDGPVSEEKVDEIVNNISLQESQDEILASASQAHEKEDSSIVSEEMITHSHFANTVVMSQRSVPKPRGRRSRTTARKGTIKTVAPIYGDQSENECDEKLENEDSSLNANKNERQTTKRSMAEPPRTVNSPPPAKINKPLEPTSAEKGPTPEEKSRQMAKEIAKSVIESLNIGPLDELQKESITRADVYVRALKVNEMLKRTVKSVQEENAKLRSLVGDVQAICTDFGESAKVQMNGIVAAVSSLAKELRFFKVECISESKSTHEEYKKQKEQFDVKYGYRVMEREILQGRFDQLEEKMNGARLHMRKMADEMARMENDIRDLEKVKKDAQLGKYTKCQTCVANEVIHEKLRGEIIKLREEKATWEPKVQQLEKQVKADQERLQIVEQELKKQTFFAKTYEQMDKQNRARRKEEEAALAAAAAERHLQKPKNRNPQPQHSHLTAPLPEREIIRSEKPREEKRPPHKKEFKPEQEVLQLPSLSDCVDPEILAEAARMSGNSSLFDKPKPKVEEKTVTQPSPSKSNPQHAQKPQVVKTPKVEARTMKPNPIQVSSTTPNPPEKIQPKIVPTVKVNPTLSKQTPKQQSQHIDSSPWCERPEYHHKERYFNSNYHHRQEHQKRNPINLPRERYFPPASNNKSQYDSRSSQRRPDDDFESAPWHQSSHHSSSSRASSSSSNRWQSTNGEIRIDFNSYLNQKRNNF